MKDFDRQRELANCTFVKTMLMLIVVFYHSILCWSGDWFPAISVQRFEILATIASWLNSFHIYGFTLVSGYLFYYLRYEKGKYGQYVPFLKQKAKRLLVPYVFAAAVWVIPISAIFFPELMSNIYVYILGTAPAQLWFLLMLFGVFLLFWPLSDFLKERQMFGAVVMIGFYGVGVAGQVVLPDVYQIFRACMYMPIFWLGFKLRQWGADWLRRIPSALWLLVHILLFAVSQYISNIDGMIFTFLRLGFELVLHIVGALMAFALLQQIADKVNWKNSKAFRFVSKLSMPVYLFHQQVIYVFLYCFNGLLNPYIHSAVNFVGAMAVSLALSALLSKFSVTRFLVGEK